MDNIISDSLVPATVSRQLVWFRTDLRTYDHTALAMAARRGPAIAVFIRTLKQWQRHGHGTNKLVFWQCGVQALAERLARLHIPFRFIDVTTFDEVPPALLALAQTLECTTLHFNDEYGLNERRRDEHVVTLFEANGLQVMRYTDQVMFKPGELLTKSGNYYAVFTPFYKRWLKELTPQHLHLEEEPLPQPPLPNVDSIDPPPPDIAGVCAWTQWPAGQEEASGRLERFVQQRLMHYKRKRDFPSEPMTSELSPYLALGMVSARQCISAAACHNDGRLGDGNENITSWISELVWREFYQHILVGYRRVNEYRPFQLVTERIEWRDDEVAFQAWCDGRTGYPLIDAAMRQLVTQGWMHNRLRMVTAMFLAKHLLIDWRRGEAFFLRHLYDGELGANNGGWQWAASTGTDAAPYFRIFNPVTQSRRFDPEGIFIARYLPELASLATKDRHEPTMAQRKAVGYPAPIVDIKVTFRRALDTFKALRTA